MAKAPKTMKSALKKWEGSPADEKIDKAKGWKEGSPADMKADRKGAKSLMAKKAKSKK